MIWWYQQNGESGAVVVWADPARFGKCLRLWAGLREWEYPEYDNRRSPKTTYKYYKNTKKTGIKFRSSSLTSGSTFLLVCLTLDVILQGETIW